MIIWFYTVATSILLVSLIPLLALKKQAAILWAAFVARPMWLGTDGGLWDSRIDSRKKVKPLVLWLQEPEFC